MKKGEKLKYFKLKNDRGEEIGSDLFLGKYTVIFFFPKAFTPGCTKECLAFSDKENLKLELNPELSSKAATSSEFELDTGFDIDDEEINWVGISADTPETMSRFREKYGLRVELLSDVEKTVAKEFGVLKSVSGITRSTFIFDRNGTLRHIWDKVTVGGHSEEVAQKVRELMSFDREISPVIEQRRANRGMSRRKISRRDVETIIKAGTMAPSCANKQPWKFTAVDGEVLIDEVRNGLSEGNYWAKKAPVLIAVYGEKGSDCEMSGNRDYLPFDLGLAVGNILLQSTHMGFYAHPMAGFDPDTIKNALRIPENELLMVLIAIAYPDTTAELSEKHRQQENSRRNRKPVGEVLKWNLE